MNKIPYTYHELLHEIYNHPDDFRKLVLRMGYNKYHFYWCKDRSYMALWSTLNDFIDTPEKFTAEYAYQKIERLEAKNKQTKLL
jgi:hypothetical protein